MARKALKNKKVIIALSLIAVAVVGGALYIKLNQPDAATRANDASHGRNDDPEAVSYDPNASDTPATAQPNNSSTTKATTNSLPAPLLSKSSGNNGPVPPGSTIQFGCQAAQNLTCTITLTSKTRTINLDAKIIRPDGTDRPSANWYWTAEAGSWQVVAKTSNSNGETGTSAAQALEVQP